MSNNFSKARVLSTVSNAAKGRSLVAQFPSKRSVGNHMVENRNSGASGLVSTIELPQAELHLQNIAVVRGAAKRVPHKRLSVLLASASFGGTIAAVRHLGAAGLDVGVMAGHLLSPASWSRRGTRSYRAPAESDTQHFLERLLAIGKAQPGQILLPTSDETAWLYTENSDELKEFFLVNQPPIETMRRLLDKKLFAQAVARAGLTELPTWEPRSFEHLVQLAPELPYPILIKPRTHVHRLRNNKGIVAHSQNELIEQYRQFVDREQHRAGDTPHLPDANLPVLQHFVSSSSEGVCSVSGYIDQTGELFVTRRSTKVLQRSQPVGVGVCFESLPDDPALSESVRVLCRELGYFGMFEVEFLRFNHGWAAIDFNGRLFNQIGMDIRRGMPTPLFACLETAGRTGALRKAVAKAQGYREHAQTVFYDRFTLQAILTARTLTGRISREERAYWNAWRQRHAGNAVDFAADKSDPMPGFIHALSEVHLGLKAFRRFLHSIPRTSSVMSNVFAKAHS